MQMKKNRHYPCKKQVMPVFGVFADTAEKMNRKRGEWRNI